MRWRCMLAINAAIAAWYYLRLIALMFLDTDPERRSPPEQERARLLVCRRVLHARDGGHFLFAAMAVGRGAASDRVTGWSGPPANCQLRRQPRLDLAGADVNYLLQVGDENPTVADFAGVGGFVNRVDDGIRVLIVDDDLDFHTGHEVDAMLGSAVSGRRPVCAERRVPE